MLSVYFGALGFGWLLIGVSLLFGGGDKDLDHEAAVDVDHDVDLDHDADLDADHDVDLDHDVDHDLDGGHGIDAGHDLDAHHVGADGLDKDLDGMVASGGDALWLTLLSLRFWTFGAASFGLAGVLSTFAGLGEPVTGVTAALSGVGIGFAAARFFRALKRDEVSGALGLDSTVGMQGRVLLPIERGGMGKIAVHTDAGRVELKATTLDDGPLRVNGPCLVVSVEDGVATVTGLDRPEPRTGREQTPEAARE